MKLTAKRLALLELIVLENVFYRCKVDDTMSLNWLEEKGLVEVGFSYRYLTTVIQATKSGADQIKGAKNGS